MIVTGLRGVGKTVLLGTFREKSENDNWAVIEIEVSKHDDAHFRLQLSQEFRQACSRYRPRASGGTGQFLPPGCFVEAND